MFHVLPESALLFVLMQRCSIHLFRVCFCMHVHWTGTCTAVGVMDCVTLTTADAVI